MSDTIRINKEDYNNKSSAWLKVAPKLYDTYDTHTDFQVKLAS